MDKKYVEVIDYGDSILERLQNVFTQAATETFPDVRVTVLLRETTNLKFGDYQFNSSPQIAKALAERGTKIAPNDVAKKLASHLPKVEIIEKAEVVNVFINIFLNQQTVNKRITAAFTEGVNVPQVRPKKVCIDFSSPNIAKQMHVGHLRSTIIGESFARLFEFIGFEVSRINHVGDWGTQFGMLIAHLQDRFPNYESEMPAIADLQTFYKESKKRFDEEPQFKERAYSRVVALQNHEPAIHRAWQTICDISRKDFNNIYKRLDVTVYERGESFYQDRMVDVVALLEKTGKLAYDEGRRVYWPPGAEIPLTIVKSDGGYTYDTSDMATIRHRIEEEKGDWLLYVVDRGQATHFELIFAAARHLGWYEPQRTRVEHVPFGVVLGEDKKKFKSRSGDTPKLSELLDEGVQRARTKLKEKQREEEFSADEVETAVTAIAYGCIRYADLSNSRTSDYVFSFDRMLDDRGNTAVYLLYAYARIRSIIRKTEVSKEQLEEYASALPDAELPLEETAELGLAKHIMRFSDAVLLVLETLQMHKMCDYVYKLAKLLHDFYNECYVVNRDSEGRVTTVNYHRLILCHVTADVMKRCFHILGLRPIERM